MSPDLEPRTPREQMLYEWGVFNGLGQADYLLGDWPDDGSPFADELNEIRHNLNDMRERRGAVFTAAAKKVQA